MAYSEADTKAKLITPKLKESGWSELHSAQQQKMQSLLDLKLSILEQAFRGVL